MLLCGLSAFVLLYDAKISMPTWIAETGGNKIIIENNDLCIALAVALGYLLVRLLLLWYVVKAETAERWIKETNATVSSAQKVVKLAGEQRERLEKLKVITDIDPLLRMRPQLEMDRFAVEWETLPHVIDQLDRLVERISTYDGPDKSDDYRNAMDGALHLIKQHREAAASIPDRYARQLEASKLELDSLPKISSQIATIFREVKKTLEEVSHVTEIVDRAAKNFEEKKSIAARTSRVDVSVFGLMIPSLLCILSIGALICTFFDLCSLIVL